MSFFTPVDCWRIPEGAFAASLEEMAIDGLQGNEGVALWLGRRNAGQAEITHVVRLRGPGLIKRPDQLVIPATFINKVTDLAIELGVALVAQIHSHGTLYGTNLSYTDRKYGISVPYYLSLVAPDFALRQGITVTDCGVHVFVPKQGFRRLSAEDVEKRLGIVTSTAVPVVTIGQE
jgi:hypothetical protein